MDHRRLGPPTAFLSQRLGGPWKSYWYARHAMLMVFSHFLTKETPLAVALLGTIHFFLWLAVAVSTFRGSRSGVLVHVVWQVPL